MTPFFFSRSRRADSDCKFWDTSSIEICENRKSGDTAWTSVDDEEMSRNQKKRIAQQR